MRELARLVPDIVVLARRLATDPRLPRRHKLAVAALAAYLASPIDLIPDFIPVLGQLDDAALASLVLRRVLRRAGPLVDELWPGTPTGLALIKRLTR